MRGATRYLDPAASGKKLAVKDVIANCRRSRSTPRRLDGVAVEEERPVGRITQVSGQQLVRQL